LTPTSLATGSEGKVADGGIEKGAKLCAKFKAGKFAEQIEKRFLHHIKRERFIAREAKGQIDRPVAMTAIQHLERCMAARVDGSNEFRVVW
jgi:hypothetical protein